MQTDKHKGTSLTTKHKRHDSDDESASSQAKSDPRRLANNSHSRKNDGICPVRRVSPLRRTRHDSESDISPPRSSAQTRSSSPSKKIQKLRHDSDSDLSPKRGTSTTNKHIDSLSRQSRESAAQNNHSDLDRHRNKVVERRTSSGSDISPPRLIKKELRHDSDSDQSLPRRNDQQDSDLSPPRKCILESLP